MRFPCPGGRPGGGAEAEDFPWRLRLLNQVEELLDLHSGGLTLR